MEATEYDDVITVLREARLDPMVRIKRLVAKGDQRLYAAGDWIVRLWYGQSGDNIARSRAALRVLAGAVQVPHLVYTDVARPVPPYQVEITAHVSGVTCEQAWPALSQNARRKLVAQLAAQMQAMHQLPTGCLHELADLDGSQPWAERCHARIASLLARARRATGVDQAELTRVERFVARHGGTLDEPQHLTLVHTDIHLGNVMIANEQMTGLIDFELAEVDARDRDAYMFIGDSIGDFLGHGHEMPQTNQTLEIVRWLQQDYPALYATPGFSARQMLYLMLEPDDWNGSDIAGAANTWIRVLDSGIIERWFGPF